MSKSSQGKGAWELEGSGNNHGRGQLESQSQWNFRSGVVPSRKSMTTNPYLDRVARLHVQGDGLARQGLDEDLQATSHTQHLWQVQRALLRALENKGSSHSPAS